MHPIALSANAPSFLNQRSLTFIDAPRFGRLAMVEVGALTVGSIEQCFAPGPVKRGAEKGRFHFGGSTVVLLVERNKVEWDEDLLAHTRRGEECFVKMGVRVARAIS